MSNVIEKRFCHDCQQPFEINITRWEVLLAQKPNMVLPKRCLDCRAKRREAMKPKDENLYGFK